MVIYTLESAGPAGVAGALATLSTVFPDAKFVPSAEPGKLAVWARPADHAEIRKAIEEMDKKEPPEKAHSVAAYSIETTSPYGVSGVVATLTLMFPDARIAAGSEPDKVIAWARPADQKAIQAAVEQMAKKDPAATARTAVVYNIESTSPYAVSSAVSALTTIYPNARFAVGTEPGKLVAHARPAEHEEIKKTIDQLALKDPPETARRMVIYTLESAGPAGIAGATATLSTVFPDAKFVPSAEPGKLAVWARPADHTEIKKAIDEMDKKEPAEKCTPWRRTRSNRPVLTAFPESSAP